MTKSIVFFVNRLCFGAALMMALASCHNVYLEQPMPQKGADARNFPKEWLGVYEGLDEKSEARLASPNSSDDYFHPLLRFENIGDNKILVSEEVRLHQNHVEKVRAQLEKEKKRGDVISFSISENFLTVTKKIEKDGVTYPESQYLNLYKAGEWYIVGQGSAPRYLLDFQARTFTEYEKPATSTLSAAMIEMADTLAGTTNDMVARLKDGALYINIKEEENRWRWFYLEIQENGELHVKNQMLNSLEYFKANKSKYDGITPFSDLGDDDFRINPDDAAFKMLLDDEKLFQVTILKKIQ